MTMALSCFFMVSFLANFLHSRVSGGQNKKLFYIPSAGAVKHLNNAWLALAIVASAIALVLLWRGESHAIVEYLTIPIIAGLVIWQNIYAIIHRSTRPIVKRIRDAKK